MILNDRQILKLCRKREMIYPFHEQQVRFAAPPKFELPLPGAAETPGSRAVISYGPSSFGYDIRVAGEFKIFTNALQAVVDPKNFDEHSFVDVSASWCNPVRIPPNSFALARSVEYIRMPPDLTGLVLGKSSYARCGVVTNFTPLEAGWEGEVTIEISNSAPLPALIYPFEGIAQVLFFRGERPQVSYADRAGKYQAQRGITLPRL